jgi:hypothetical protein
MLVLMLRQLYLTTLRKYMPIPVLLRVLTSGCWLLMPVILATQEVHILMPDPGKFSKTLS